MSDLKHQVHQYRKLDCRWQKLIGQRCARTSQLVFHSRSAAYVNWVLKRTKARSEHHHAQAKRWMVRRTNAMVTQIHRWSKMLGVSWFDRQLLGEMNTEQRYNQMLKLYANYEKRWNASFLYNAFLCIHHYEGAWDANTGNGYYGGMQMDKTFQSQYGSEFVRRWGSADNWPAWAQIQASVKAYRSGRGFGPWPNTARACGLL